MFGHVYITHRGNTMIYKTTDTHYIYNALINMGWDHEDAEDVASWAQLATIGEEYASGDPSVEIISIGK